jgi:hypothetical protein
MGVGDGKVVETDQQMLENYGKIVEKWWDIMKNDRETMEK